MNSYLVCCQTTADQPGGRMKVNRWTQCLVSFCSRCCDRVVDGIPNNVARQLSLHPEVLIDGLWNFQIHILESILVERFLRNHIRQKLQQQQYQVM